MKFYSFGVFMKNKLFQILVLVTILICSSFSFCACEFTNDNNSSENSSSSQSVSSSNESSSNLIVLPKTVVENGLTFILLSDNTYEVSSFDKSVNSVSIPKIIEGAKVTSIGDEVFFECSSLTSIEIPNSVTKIGQSSFYGCELLESVIFEDDSSLETIGLFAFSNCIALHSIVLPYSVKLIYACAFRRCKNLNSVTFENTSGWFVAKNSFATSGTNISSDELLDQTTVVTYLTSTYYMDCWIRG